MAAEGIQEETLVELEVVDRHRDTHLGKVLVVVVGLKSKDSKGKEKEELLAMVVVEDKLLERKAAAESLVVVVLVCLDM